MKTLQQSHTSIGWQFTAYSDDGSLEDATQQFITLLTALFAWIQLQLSIAGVASDLIIEARLVMQRAYIALGLAIEIMAIILSWLRWIDDIAQVVKWVWDTQMVGVFSWKLSYIPG